MINQPVKRRAVPTRPKSSSYSLKTIIVTNLATLIVAVSVFFLTSIMFAQESDMLVHGGESVMLECDGRRFNISRISRTETELTCIALPGQTPPVQPTELPVEPTAVPVEPTTIPIEPTAIPIEPTVIPVEPTEVPVIPPPAPPEEPPVPPEQPPITGRAFYVSKLGNNSDGLSWESAWNELNQVDWSKFQPGDTLLIDGGAESMTYRTTLQPTASGTAAEPIRIQLAGENGRNGQAIFFGGRSTPLPHCGQTSYSYNPNGLTTNGAKFEGVSWITIDGTKWRGIVIHGMNGDGIRLYSNTDNLTFRHMEIYDNGTVKQSGGGYYSDAKGIRLEGSNHTVERTIIHDNGQDAIQSNGANVSNFTIRESWFYNGRQHPNIDQSYNYCTHSDALQIFDGGVVSGINIEDSVLGPGFTNTILLGDKNVDVNNVTINNVLILKSAENSISAHSTATTSVNNWNISNVTVYGPNTAYNAITYKGRELAITNSVFVGSHINIPNTSPAFGNNCQWDTTGIDIGVDTNPQFTSASPEAFTDGNYAVNERACATSGSSITSIDDLMALPDNQ
ncbi:MAG: hypothetical protein AAF490_17975 [Chloroflexota bacterium]